VNSTSIPAFRRSKMRDIALRLVLWCVLWPLQVLFQLWMMLTPRASQRWRPPIDSGISPTHQNEGAVASIGVDPDTSYTNPSSSFGQN
jgi:hypothetical protein